MNNILQMAKDKTECISALQTALTLKKARKTMSEFHFLIVEYLC